MLAGLLAARWPPISTSPATSAATATAAPIYAAPGGTEIYAVSGGVVTAAAYHWSWGYYVQVYHGKDDNGNTYSTLYAHMNSAPVVSVGQPVEKGKVLGYVGSTGNSTGNHLHLEMKVNNVLVNVMNYLS